MNIQNRAIGLICGGPSPERGISLNSARSVMDHLQDQNTHIVPFYVDLQKNFYRIDPAQLYSNTPSDFDFKLAHSAKQLSTKETINALQSVDIVFPAIHGEFGETGELQAFLEFHNIPFVGSSAYTCQNMFYKDRASDILKQAGFDTIPSCHLKKGHHSNTHLIEYFWGEHAIKRAIVKPSAGGSSIGIHSVDSLQAAIDIVAKADDDMLIEPFCQGQEFTVVVLQNHAQEPVALVPAGIQICYENQQFFDYRRKYLPNCNTTWSCPPHFSDTVIQKIQSEAEAIFKLFYMRDFARLDGWLLHDGRIVFSDFNPISGMEQNSFLFLQASRAGMSHKEVLSYIVDHALSR